MPLTSTSEYQEVWDSSPFSKPPLRRHFPKLSIREELGNLPSKLGQLTSTHLNQLCQINPLRFGEGPKASFGGRGKGAPIPTGNSWEMAGGSSLGRAL